MAKQLSFDERLENWLITASAEEIAQAMAKLRLIGRVKGLPGAPAKIGRPRKIKTAPPIAIDPAGHVPQFPERLAAS